MRTIPRPIVSTFKIRRAWTQIIDYRPSSGFFGSGSGNIQIQFMAGASTINIGGAGVYSPVLPNSTDFSNLFDQYRINKITLRCDWTTNSVPAADVVSTPPLIYIVPDYDDSSDAGVTDLVQYPACRTHSFLQNGYSPLIFAMTPTPLKDVAGAGITTYYAPDTSRSFMRTSSLNIPHYGVKLAADVFGATSTSITGKLQFTCFIDLEFINPK